MGYSEYKDLTPIDNINNGDEYLNALEWALNNPKVKNIALAGPYGAGKSSIIETYLSREKDKKNIYEQHKFAKKYLKISMATFIEAHNNEGNETKIEIDADEVEKGILKQLFYKVEHKKIPQSRYRKLQPIHSMNVLVKVIMTSIILILFGEIFFPDICKNIWNKIDAFAMRYSWLVGKTAGVAIVLAIVGIGITSYLAKIIMSRFRVKELKLPADTTLQVSEDTEESVFNKNLDEIMYFFEETQYQLIFFEDLDRLENRKIFVHLRELNNLLNNDEAINHKPIVFVYAVRDDIFSKEDRTKFFDFIIPVIPIVNATNSGEILLEKLDNAKEHGICHKISQGFVLDIAPFISDMRIIQNIYNEFVVYKKTLQTEQHLNLSDEQMMAIIIFKNLYPSDFADIQGEKGIIKKAFQDRNVYVFTKIKELQQKIDSNTELVEKTTQNIFKSVRELKYAFLVEITEGEGVARGFNGYPGRISSANVLSDNFDLHQFQEKDYRAEYVSFSGHTGVVDMSEKVDVVDEYIKRCEAIKKYTDKNIEKIKEEIIELKNKKQKLSSRSIQWLIENDSSENVLSKEVKDNKFLVFLLRRGYLDEKYANYINYFKGNSITTNDMNFILAVKNQEPQPFDYQLTKIKQVIQRLQDYEFEQKAIYNFQIMEELLGEEKISNKLEVFVRQLADGAETSWQFIDEFVDKTKYQKKFVQILSAKWNSMWEYILRQNTMTYGRQVYYLKLIIEYVDEKELSLLNVENCITSYFEKHEDILQQLNDVSSNKIIAAINNCDICFEKLNIANVSDDVVEYIFDNCRFKLNDCMIRNVISYKKKNLLKMFENQPYSTIIKLEYQPLTEYVYENMKEYIEAVVLKKTIIEDEKEDIIDLLRRTLEESDLCANIIRLENFEIEKLADCLEQEIQNKRDKVGVVWNTLLEQNKIGISWENTMLYWKYYSISNYLKKFIEVNVDKLSVEKNNYVTDNFAKDIINAKFEDSVLKKLLPVLPMKTFDLDVEQLPENILAIMVECNYFGYTIEYYQSIAERNEDIAVEYIVKNQAEFYNSLEDFSMTKNVLERLLFEQKIPMDNREELFEKYAKTYMTEKIALNMNAEGFKVTKTLFDIAWEILSENQKERLMIANLELLNVDDMEKCFGELSGQYSVLTERTKRRNIKLDNTENNRKLVEYLKKIDYITSFWEEEKTEPNGNRQVISIGCKIKQKK